MARSPLSVDDDWDDSAYERMRKLRQRRAQEIATELFGDGELFVTFVYGTLRPGEHNYWIEPAVIQSIEDCTTPGVMYATGIPWCDFVTTDQGLVTGTLLVMEQKHSLTVSMIGMEIGASYVPIEVPITLPGRDHPGVLAWAWHAPRYEGLGSSPPTYVPSGNFRDTPGSTYYSH